MGSLKSPIRGRCVEIFVPLVRNGQPCPPFGSEVLEAWPRKDGRFRVESVPFFSPELNRRDLIDALPNNRGELEFLALSQAEGHRTIVIALRKPAGRRLLVAEMTALGCRVDGVDSDYFVAVDLAPDADVEDVVALLSFAESRGLIEWWWKDAVADESNDSCTSCREDEVDERPAQVVLGHGGGHQAWRRIPYGDEAEGLCPCCGEQMIPCGPCPCCLAEAGTMHQAGCCQEECPACGDALQECPCPIAAFGLSEGVDQ